MTKKVIIIGAGPAGLTAAYELLKSKKSYDVIILEAQNQVGGISKTLNHNGNRMDIGGHRFFSKDDRVMDWWLSMLPLQGAASVDDIILNREKSLNSGGPDPEGEDSVMLIRNRISRIYYLNKFFDYPVSLKMQTLVNMGFWRTVKVAISYIFSVIKKRTPENTLEDFMINRFGKELYSMFFENYTEKVWGRHPSKISAAWGAQRIKGLSIRKIIADVFSKIFKKRSTDIRQKDVETSLIEQFFYPKFGPGQLWETVAAHIMNDGGKIEMNCEVTGIELNDNQISAVTCNNGKRYEGDIVISSMPIKDLVTGLPKSAIDENVRMDALQLPYRDFITVGLYVDQLKIKNTSKIKTINNIIPDCWIYIQDENVKLGRLQIFNNWSPYMVKEFKDHVWMGLEYFCDEGDALWEMPDEEIIAFAAVELNKIGIIDKDDVKDGVRFNVKKAYPAYFDSYERFAGIKEALSRFKNLYCIGRNGQHRYNNMDHSMLTAFYAVEDINSGGTLEKAKVWGVNVESDYHEEK